MKVKLTLAAITLALASLNTQAAEFLLTHAATGSDVGNWQVTSSTLGMTSGPAFSIEKRQLHGGKQAGVDVLVINNGELSVTLVPTRGMGIYQVARQGHRILGWDSPVKEIVNPAYIDLESRNGLGWLDGFNEMMVRCGFEWTGHPGYDDDGHLLTLHGRVQNTPASMVKVIIDDQPPHKITVLGQVAERTFKKTQLVTMTELQTVPGSNAFSIHDTLTNVADYDDEYQIIYHSNFGRPILEKGAKVTIAASEISPFNDYAKAGLKDWQTYMGPTKGFDEMVFNLKSLGDSKGNTLAVLNNQAANSGVSIQYNVKQLPVIGLWKNTDTESQGYVTGIEPGTSYSYNTKLQRPLGLVPTIKAGESKHFDLTYTVLRSSDEVKGALKQVANIMKGKEVKLVKEPLAKE
ncbi:aldose 1-epimerase family protein [Vibrio porteresiae]|uniref:Aldose 1-epimerase family protein n=1 Tax=Vibrio porteresiae DSM 19223 TaxID=1123496 RepID=A0ABZ0QJC4_9VIBR|nr:aldose 1-epimerase family protein [Vibrio porteresiae]WPC76604.1 aldose 1-epimerase family protein [Vibrio porteresiae DSM 19223]